MARAKLDDQFDEADSIMDALLATAAYHVRKPSNIAWTLGIVGAVGIVFSNALFFQEGAHPAAFFETRTSNSDHSLKADEMTLPVNDVASNQQSNVEQKAVTRIVFDPNSDTVPMPVARPESTQQVLDAVQKVELQLAEQQSVKSENTLEELQGLLAELGYYKGEIDGLEGPQTLSAIESYKANVGLRGIELTHEQLITSSKNNLIVTAAIPKTRPAPETQVAAVPNVEQSEVKTAAYIPPSPANVAAQPSSTIAKVQAGLRAFGNDSITIDGVTGSQTTQAIQEFQSLFKLPVTGKIDANLIAKMTDVGLID